MSETSENMKVGEIFKNARLKSKRNRELSIIARKLCIKEDYLSALEEGDYARFPEKIYIFGFARNYALELGLDPAMISDLIKKELNITNDLTLGTSNNCLITDDKKEESEENKSNPSLFNLSKQDLNNFNPLQKFKSVLKNKKLVTSIVSFFVILIVLIWILSAIFSKHGNIEQENIKNNTVTEKVIDSLTAPAFSIPVKSEFGKDNKSEAEFIIQSTEETWIKLEDKKSREVLFSRVMMPGDVYYVSKNNTNLLTVGDAGSIVIYLHGTAMPPIGGKNVRLTQIPLIPETFTLNNDVRLEKSND